MKVVELKIPCECERGFMFKTSLQDNDGKPIMFMLTSEYIYFQGYCSHCGKTFELAVPLMDLVFATERRSH